MTGWEPSRCETISSGLARVSVMLVTGSATEALEIARNTLERERARSGELALQLRTGERVELKDGADS